MKKFILGLLVGMSLMLAGSAFADDIQSFIGKTIQGQFPVTVDGKNLDMPAIVIDGNSFLPVRSFGESVGYNVYFDPEGAIKLEKQIAITPETTVNAESRQAAYDAAKAENQKQLDEQNQQSQREANIELLQKQVDYLQQRVVDMTKGVEIAKQMFIDSGGTEEDFKAGANYKEYLKIQAELEQKQTELQQALQQ